MSRKASFLFWNLGAMRPRVSLSVGVELLLGPGRWAVLLILGINCQAEPSICHSRFQNTPRFRVAPRIPPKNPILTSLSEPAQPSSGKKGAFRKVLIITQIQRQFPKFSQIFTWQLNFNCQMKRIYKSLKTSQLQGFQPISAKSEIVQIQRHVTAAPQGVLL